MQFLLHQFASASYSGYTGCTKKSWRTLKGYNFLIFLQQRKYDSKGYLLESQVLLQLVANVYTMQKCK